MKRITTTAAAAVAMGMAVLEAKQTANIKDQTQKMTNQLAK